MDTKLDKIRIEAFRDVSRWRNKVGLVAWKGSGPLAAELIFREIPDGSAASPLLVADPEDLQVLVDSLWEAGVRPSQAEGSAGQLAAVNRHLQDMRAITFQKLGIKPKLE